MRRIYFLFVFVFSLLSCRAQVPENRPPIGANDFDQRLTKLLSFSVPLLGVDDLRTHSEKYLVLDAREREEFEVSHIPGARYLGYDEFNPAAIADVPRDQPIVLYCSVGYRSEKIGEKLRDQGFTNVYNLYGSIFEWANRGYPLVTPQGEETNKLHTYNRTWSQWVADSTVQKTW